MAAEAVRWSCARCKVSVGQIDGGTTLLPTTWSHLGGEILCLTCTRAQAGEAAMDSAPAETSREDRAKLRCTALIEFEIERAPEAPIPPLALPCRTSSAAVAAVRDELDRDATTSLEPTPAA